MRKKTTKSPKTTEKPKHCCPFCYELVAPAEENIISFTFSDGGIARIHFRDLYKLSKQKNGEHYLPQVGLTMNPKFDLISYFNKARENIISLSNDKKKYKVTEKKIKNTVSLILFFLEKARVENKERKVNLSLSSYYGGFSEFLKTGLVLNYLVKRL